MDAWDANAADLLRRANGVPIRVASKSLRSRELIRDVLKREGFSGVLALTLPEALWLVGTDVTDDVLVGYPTADRGALFRLVQDEQLAATVTIMVDDGARQYGFASSSTARGDRATGRCASGLGALRCGHPSPSASWPRS